MPATSMPRTPEGRLIRRARTQARLSIPAAAKLAGISPEHWGNVERGYRSTSAGERDDVTATADTLALMARTTGVPAGTLAEDGNRPDAAQALREMEGLASLPGPQGNAGDAEQAEIIASVRMLYPGDGVAEAIMSQWQKPMDVRTRELDEWRAKQAAARA